MSTGVLVFAGAGREDELLWQSASGATDAGGNLQLNFGSGNGFQVAAIKGYSTAAAPATVGFSYQGGVALPDSQYPEAAPLAPGATTDPVAIGLTVNPEKTLLVNLSGGGAVVTWTVWVLFRRNRAC